MVSHLKKKNTYKGCKIALMFFLGFFLANLGVNNLSLSFGKFCKDQEVLQQGSGGYTTRIRRLNIKNQEVI